MIEIEDLPIVAIDVDNTIIWWEIKKGHPTIDIQVDDHTHTFSIHEKHVEALKKHKARGHQVIVWSAGGKKWCKAVVKALQLDEYVDIIMPKPDWIYDDLSPNEFLPNNLYIHEGEENK